MLQNMYNIECRLIQIQSQGSLGDEPVQPESIAKSLQKNQKVIKPSTSPFISLYKTVHRSASFRTEEATVPSGFSLLNSGLDTPIKSIRPAAQLLFTRHALFPDMPDDVVLHPFDQFPSHRHRILHHAIRMKEWVARPKHLLDSRSLFDVTSQTAFERPHQP